MVSIEVWRCRIGRYKGCHGGQRLRLSPSAKSPRCRSHQLHDPPLLKSPIFFLAVLAALCVTGLNSVHGPAMPLCHQHFSVTHNQYSKVGVDGVPDNVSVPLAVEMMITCLGLFESFVSLKEQIGRRRCYCHVNCFGALSELLLSNLELAVILVLLCIGNIELNPGPGFVFRCSERSCKFSTTDVQAHVSHQRMHCSSSNFLFKCPWPTCHLSFTTYKAAYMHVQRQHQQKDTGKDGTTTVVEERELFICSFKEGCGTFGSRYDLCQHAIDHLDNGEGPIRCPLRCVTKTTGDTPTFQAVNGLRTHLAVKHKGWANKILRLATTSGASTSGASTSHQQLEGGGENDVSMDIEGETNDDYEQFYDADEGDEFFSFDNVVNSVAKFYLMLEGHLYLPVTTVQTISDYLQYMSELTQIKVKQTLEKDLDSLNLTEEKKNQILKRVLMSDPIYATHHLHSQGPTFTTNRRRRAYYKANFEYVDVRQINVCTRDLFEKQYAHYVPVKKTLEILLKDEDVKEQITKSFNKPVTDPDLIDNYTKGSFYLSEPANVNSRCIDVMLFIDAFNMVNPLGAAKTLYKTVGVYMTLLNLSAFDRSKLDSMHLIMLVQEKFLESCNHSTCNESCSHLSSFESIIKDLNELFEDGIMFDGEKVRVRLRFVVGDSLGAHQIGGLLRNFSRAKYFCRFCEILYPDFKINPHKCMGERRTVVNYNNHVRRLKLQRASGQTRKSYRGIRVKSVLNRIHGFHVATPSLPPCLGHDLFEGVASWDMRYVIDQCIEKKWFTLNEFKQRLKDFKPVGYDSTNKPKSISKKSSKGLGIHAVQVWFVIRVFSFLVGHKIPDKQDKVWVLYLKLKRMTEYICAPKLTRLQIEEMRLIILDYMATRKELKLKFKPKHHFLLHYASIYLALGPLIALWGMRFESMHSIFKRIAMNSRNFINITLTMARKYQLRLAYQATGPLLKKTVVVHSRSEVKLSEAELDSFAEALVPQFSEAAVVTSEVEVNGLQFKKEDWVLFGFNGPQSISMGRIDHIICDGPDVRFVIKTASAVYVPDVGLYQIDLSRVDSCVLAASSVQSQTQPVYKYRGNLYFSLKVQLQEV